eukprot:1339166-Pyramimonas_sp.AAC.1
MYARTFGSHVFSSERGWPAKVVNAGPAGNDARVTMECRSSIPCGLTVSQNGSGMAAMVPETIQYSPKTARRPIMTAQGNLVWTRLHRRWSHDGPSWPP